MAITRKTPKTDDEAPAESVTLATPVQDQGSNPPAPADPGPLSFSDVSDDDAITSRGAGGASEKTSVFDEVIKASYQENKRKGFTVPTDTARAQMTALRSAANRLHVGLKVRSKDNDNGTTTVQFIAGDKQVRGPRKSRDQKLGEDLSAAPTDGATDSPSDDA